MTTDLFWAAVSLLTLCLGAAAWLAWREAQPPRCPSCGARTTPQDSRIVTAVGPVMETIYQCARCRCTVCRRQAYQWD